MILDEPTNDLDILTLQSLESSLLQYNGGLVFTSHDRYFVQRVATHIMMWRGVEEKNGVKLTKWSLFADLDQALLTYDEDKKLVKQVADAVVGKDKTIVSRKDTKATKPAKPSQKEQKELQDLEAKIGQLEASSIGLTQQLESAFSQGKSTKETGEISDKLKSLSKQIVASQLRWEELFASH